jgi:peptidoglycan/xylan/chitin deacetylase (PgdA/CDA1 family)
VDDPAPVRHARRAQSNLARLALRSRPPIVRAAGTICGVETGDPVVAITFDDGPDPANTPVVLSLLADHGARATFFVISEQARKYPSLVKEIVAAGHDVGLHAQRHIDLTDVPPWTAIRAVRGGQHELEDVMGAPVELFRPPYGTQSLFTFAVARTAGLEVVGWSASPRDFLTLDVDRHVAITFEDLGPGGIVLLHDGPPPNPGRRAAVLGAVLEAMAGRGWRGVDVKALLDGRTPLHRLWFFRRARAVIEEMRPLIITEDRAAGPQEPG